MLVLVLGRRTAREREAEKDGRLRVRHALRPTYVLACTSTWYGPQPESRVSLARRRSPLAADGRAATPRSPSRTARAWRRRRRLMDPASWILHHGPRAGWQAGRPGGGGRLLWGPRQAACREEAARGGKRETASETAWMVTGGGSLASPGPLGPLAPWLLVPGAPHRQSRARCRRIVDARIDLAAMHQRRANGLHRAAPCTETRRDCAA